MPDLTTSSAVDTFMQSANKTEMRAVLDLTQGTQPIWVMAAFNGIPEVLTISASYDLKDWIPLCTYAHPTQGIRDPQLLFHRGRWYCSYTQGNSTHNNNEFGILVSDDLLHWGALLTVNLSAHVAVPQWLWGPILAQDANGDAYLYVLATTDGNIIYMRPTDQDDLTTLAFVANLSMPAGSGLVPNSAFYRNGVYYFEGPASNPGGAGRKMFTATDAAGPYIYDADLAAAGLSAAIDAIELTEDNGTWYAFSNMDLKAIPQYQVSEGGYAAFGDMQFGALRRFLNGPFHTGHFNPSVHRYYGAAAASARAAVQEFIANAVPTTGQKVPQRDSWDYLFAVANGGAGARETTASAYNALHVASGTTANGHATVTLAEDCFNEGLGSNAATLTGNYHKPLDFRARLIATPTLTSPIRVLFGVESGHLGTLDEVGVGLEFFGGGVLNLIMHDGASLAVVDTTTWVVVLPLELRVRIEGPAMVVWVNGIEQFRYFDLPTVEAQALANTFRCIVVQADYGGTGGSSEAWVINAFVHWWEK